MRRSNPAVCISFRSPEKQFICQDVYIRENRGNLNGILHSGHMKEIWIIGIGQFGLHAVLTLANEHPHAHLVLVDPFEDNLLRAAGSNRFLKVADGVSYTEKNLLSAEKGPDWIVPALPIHLAAEWCLRRHGPRLRRYAVPNTLDPHIPNPMRVSDGNVYTSHATFRCPENCSEPEDVCSITAEPRKKNMFEILGDLHLPHFEPIAIRSHQLGPGIGGYRPAQLFALDKRLNATRGGILLSTACRCHGVTTGLWHD